MNIKKIYSTDVMINTLKNIDDAMSKSYAAALSVKIETSSGEILPVFGLDSCSMEMITASIKDNLELQLKSRRKVLELEISNIDNHFSKNK